MTAAFDHLVVAAATLEQGEKHIEALLGVRPQRGGKHVAMGTHNSLLKLGSKSFLEVIAVDPDGKLHVTVFQGRAEAIVQTGAGEVKQERNQFIGAEKVFEIERRVLLRTRG